MGRQRGNRPPDAGRIAITESWAEHLEHVYTDRAYGGNNSWALANTWQTVLEELRNDSPNHVPIGLHFDLFDNVPDVNNACDREGGGCGPMVDHVAGFASLQQLNVFDPFVGTVEGFQAHFWQQSGPNGNTLAIYNANSSA